MFRSALVVAFAVGLLAASCGRGALFHGWRNRRTEGITMRLETRLGRKAPPVGIPAGRTPPPLPAGRESAVPR